MFKKVISVLAATAMTAAIIPSAVMADEAVKEHGTALSDRSNVDVDIRFGLWGDSHVTVKPIWTTADQALDRLMDAYEIIDKDIDGFAMPGDIIYNLGPTSEETHDDKVKYNAVIDEIVEDFPNITKDKLAWAMGNHEITGGAYANSSDIGNFDEGRTWQEEVADNYKNYEEVFGVHPIHSQVINGYTFVTTAAYDYLNNYINPENKDENGKIIDVISEKEIKMRELLQAGLDADATKPVFFITHDGIDKTSIASTTTAPVRYSTEFRNFIINNPRIVTMTGHYHYPANDPRCIWQDEQTGSTHITTPAVLGMAKTYGGMTDVISNNSQATDAMLVEVKGNVVTLRRFDFVDKEYIGEPIVFTAGAAAQSCYTNTGRAAAAASTVNKAYFPEGSEIEVSNIMSVSADIQFGEAQKDGESAEGLQDYFPCVYRVSVKNNKTNSVVKSTTMLGTFMFNSVDTLWFAEDHQYHEYTGMNKKDIPHKWSITGLERDTEYTVTVTPESVLGQKGVPMTTVFKTNSDKTAEQLALTKKFNQNVALGKAFIADIHGGTTDNWSKITDGNTQTSNSDTIASGGEITLDLGRAYNINKIVFDVPDYSSAKQYYKLQVSNDPNFEDSSTITLSERGGVADLSQATEFANGTTFTKNMDSSKAYRYVRYKNTLENDNGKYMYVNELQVFADVYMTNVTKGASVSASGNYTNHAAAKAIDGATNEAGSWWSDWNSKYNYLQIDLKKSVPVSMIEVWAGLDEDSQSFDENASRQNWYVYGSSSAASSSALLDNASITADGYNELMHYDKLPEYDAIIADNAPYRYITLKHGTTNFGAIAEVRAWAINPTIAGTEKTDNSIKVLFTEPMNTDTLNASNLKVYSKDGEHLDSLTYEVSADKCSVVISGDGAEDAVRVEATYSVLAESGMDIAGNMVRYFESNIDLSGKPVITEENVNVSKGKNITGRNIKLDGSVSLAPLVDGDENTSVYMFSNIDAEGTTNVTPSDITIDLEKRYAIDKIEIVMDDTNNGGKQCFELQLSNDAEFNDYDAVFTAGGYVDINAESGFDGNKLTINLNKKADYRYVRIARTAYAWFEAREISVYADVNYMEISRGSNVTASHAYSANMGPDKTVDGLITTGDNGWFTGWNAAGGTVLETTPWMVLDLGIEVPVTKVNMYDMYMKSAGQFGDQTSRRFWNIYGSSTKPAESDLSIVANTWPENATIASSTLTKLFTNDVVPFPANNGAPDKAYKTAELTPLWNNGTYNSTVGEGYLSEEVSGSYRYITFHKGYSYFGSLGEVQVYTIAPKANCVSVDGDTVTVTFSDAIFPTYMTSDYIKLYDASGNEVSYTDSVIVDEYTYQFTADIAEDTQYKVVASANIKAFSSMPLGTDNELAFSVTSFDYSAEPKNENGAYSVDVTVTSAEDLPVRILVAEYNGERLAMAKFIDVTADADGHTENISGFTYNESNTYKVFLWNPTTYEPLCEAIPLS